MKVKDLTIKDFVLILQHRSHLIDGKNTTSFIEELGDGRVIIDGVFNLEKEIDEEKINSLKDYINEQK